MEKYKDMEEISMKKVKRGKVKERGKVQKRSEKGCGLVWDVSMVVFEKSRKRGL